MKITTKGQVTIPQDIRERLGLLPHTEVDFEVRGDVRARRGTPGEPRLDGRSATFDYEGLDGQRTIGEIVAQSRLDHDRALRLCHRLCSVGAARRRNKPRTANL